MGELWGTSVHEFYTYEGAVRLAEALKTWQGGRLVVNILGAVSQWEREAIAERTSAALSHKKSKGEYCGGKVPFGFRVEDGMLVKDEQQAAAAVRIRQLHASGVSLRKIADALTAEGYPHPCGRWNHSTVARCIAAE
jgi:DNA invertase Pin-like site-specific DNA recombinase